jgi:hypothetical protein
MAASCRAAQGCKKHIVEGIGFTGVAEDRRHPQLSKIPANLKNEGGIGLS